MKDRRWIALCAIGLVVLAIMNLPDAASRRVKVVVRDGISPLPNITIGGSPLRCTTIGYGGSSCHPTSSAALAVTIGVQCSSAAIAGVVATFSSGSTVAAVTATIAAFIDANCSSHRRAEFLLM